MATQSVNKSQAGFILPMALVVLAMLSLGAVAMYWTGRAGDAASRADSRSVQGYYYAEAAVHYMTWALAADAELDSPASAAGGFSAAEPKFPTNAAQVGDYREWMAYRWYPGPTVISDTNPLGKAGQIMYFDNTPMAQRAICMEQASKFPNCIDPTLPPDKQVRPRMEGISARLPRYIKLEIAADGTVAPSIPRLPHAKPPVIGQDVPRNGAIVWLTAGTAQRDIEIYPLDPYNPPGPATSLYGGRPPSACAGGALPSCPCNSRDPAFATAQACDANSGKWLATYGLVVYAIGYVQGHPAALVRAWIGP